ncbi:zinc finger and BTB domain-containing protein 40 isoform X2 [Hemiscyllium ocellatum]|uniref:zinc finger and BTB domain-containing protein 40 isoform X2 n=1 Tax=Hemiscyllium ocellatum TaxID=170820 RepID=UPI0029660E74|nr:zinc finger and BTB domain-containing protein 40 isoform X2 [Hemiscyllium ocellatum]
MELPNYSRQLMQQLYTLRKEEQFCDCTLLIGNTPFRAHKVVLAASSLLFKSLLDNTDTISIDQAVVSPEEFAVLLEMVYAGKVPPGKHNFTKVVSVADNLQMFDIAVSCKNIVANLMKHTEGNEMRASSPAIGEDALSLAIRRQCCVSQEVDNNMPASNNTEVTGPAKQNPSLEEINCTDVEGFESTNVALSAEETILFADDSKQDVEEQESSAESHVADIQSASYSSGCTEGEEILSEPPSKKGKLSITEEQDLSEQDFLMQHKQDLAQAVQDLHALVDSVVKCDDIPMEEKKVFLDCCKEAESSEVFCKLLDNVIEEKTLQLDTLLFVLERSKEAYPRLQTVLQNLNRNLPIERLIETEAKTPEDYGLDLLRRHQDNIVDAVTDLQPLRNILSVAEDISDGEKESIEDLIKEKDVVACVSNLMEGVLEKQTLAALTVWKLLIRMKEGMPKLRALLDKLQRESESLRLILSVNDEESKAVDILKRHRRLITDGIDDISPLLDCLMPGVENLPAETIEILKSCCYRETARQSLEIILGKVLEEKLIPALTFCRLLHMISESHPSLESVTKAMEHAGLMIETGSDVDEDQKEHLQNEEETHEDDAEHLEVLGHDRDSDSELLSDQKKVKPKSGTKQIFTCSACGKSFTFKCRLELHLTRCRSISHLKGTNCEEGNKTQTAQKDLEKHRVEMSGAPKGKKRRFPVTCDICGKSFAHQSGMQYHKRSDHFDEKPFSCSECGAKFAANSTLKNHMRLHTGEKPFFCKQCDMTFMQAAALAYHMKKKHSEGKMYGCQYCDAVFAQSIELTRHVRTHTGDKPYVCRECGKGFSQANGLSMHLRSFHNVEDPYDCQKCRMSFPTLEEHKKHIQDVHPPEYNPCDVCGKNFSAPSLLERHMVTHIGGKPYNCDICDKAYQQLSGLWYHNRTHHPDIFAAQNHRSPKFTTMMCSACEKSFGSTASLNKHMRSDHSDIKMLECENCKDTFATQALLHIHRKSKHSGIHPFKCSYCSSTFRFPGALHHHLSTEHLTQQTSTFVCGDCAQLFNSQQDLEEHQRSTHAGILFTHVQEAAEMVIQASEQMPATEQVVSLEETHLSNVGSQVFVALPNSQDCSSGPHEIVALNVNDLLDGSVTLICGETP